ncbi:TPA: hypothetical protein N0F65_009183 [Lagenidium giganteum]|uniref:Glycosyltransferase 61 catalytic domain-containing protein n=1 Tax=Lagenidium giganteum TaxID=4803 RepID=A0AAV2YGP5_9STRA|nr:TPA: hypothetical protein N0F65_009183 [Lagenidium giganteum]
MSDKMDPIKSLPLPRSTIAAVRARKRRKFILAIVGLAFLAIYVVCFAHMRRRLLDGVHVPALRAPTQPHRQAIAALRHQAFDELSNRESEGEPALVLDEDTDDMAIMSDSEMQAGLDGRDHQGTANLDDDDRADQAFPATQKPENCNVERDYGMIDALQKSAEKFCVSTDTDQGQNDDRVSAYTFYHAVDANVRSTYFQNLVLDLRTAQVHMPILDLAHDGKDHDPRFVYEPGIVHCRCATPQTSMEGVPCVWDQIFALAPNKSYSVCNTTPSTLTESDMLDNVIMPFTTNVVLMARRDDHNPFFQVSATLMAWIMLQVLGWDPATTQLVYLDRGLPTHTDALQQRLLSPVMHAIRGRAIMGKVLQLDHVMVAPFENTGPLMLHLNSVEPCRRSELISEFRDQALAAMDVSTIKRFPGSCTVVVISRQPYGGRRVQRMWLNEDEILARLRDEYSRDGVYRYGRCLFYSLDFVNLSIAEQMDVMINSDMVIGMHGAGMVNVLWTRPGTTVLEIFPRRRRRWGYRHLCLFIGCKWHEFRGGSDTGRCDNASHKTIPRQAVVAPNTHVFRRVIVDIQAADASIPAVQEPGCFGSRDHGMIQHIQASAKTLCAGSDERSTFTHYDSRVTDIQSTRIENLTMDLRHVQVHKPILSIVFEGGGHDPRFVYQTKIARCQCSTDQTLSSGARRIWKDILVNEPRWHYTSCVTPAADDPLPEPNRVVNTNVVLMARRDDHNPFFQLSATLTAWMMLQVVGWQPQTAQLVFLDDGFESPVTELQHKMLAPNHSVITGSEIKDSVIHMKHALIAPFECHGPLMRHLNDDEPCHRNQLVKEFRRQALATMGVASAKQDPQSCIITIISRRPYEGRHIQRVWINEADILAQMNEHYGVNSTSVPGGGCIFRSLDFASMTMAEQMQASVESDLIIGMHGAGMVNVLWSRPGTMVIEIFPRSRYRWGYRNLCQFVDCNWYQYRGGRDTGRGDNNSDKTLEYKDWRQFFDPLFQLLKISKSSSTSER